MVDEEITSDQTSEDTKRRRSLKTTNAEETSLESLHEPGEPLNEDESSLEVEPAQSYPDGGPEVTDPIVGMVERERLEEMLGDLRSLDRVTDDKGDEVEFAGESKETFLKDVENSYPVFGSALNSLYLTGKFLYEVRERQKKNQLWMKYQEVIGHSPSFINNYIRVYEKFRERLPEFSHLGVSKLEVVSRLKEPVAYIEANQEVLEKASFKEVRKIVSAEKEKGVKRRSHKVEDMVEIVGSCRLKFSSNGRSLTVSNLNKQMQDELLKVVKDYLSQRR